MMNLFPRWLRKIRLHHFQSHRADFYRQLAKSIEVKEQLRGFFAAELAISRHPHTRDDSRALALSTLLAAVSRGDGYQLSQLLNTVMPASDRMMLCALDVARDQPASLRAVADALDRQAQARSMIARALLPPLILLPGVGGFCYVLATQSLPIIVKMAPPSVWTPLNQAVRVLAEAVQFHGLTAIVLAMSATAGLVYALPRWTGRLRNRLESLAPARRLMLFPIWPLTMTLSLYRDFKVSQLLTSLAVLLGSGMTLTEALAQLRRASSPWLNSHLRQVLRHLQVAPTDYVAAFSRGLLSPALLARVASAVRTNPHFDRVLIDLGTRENQSLQTHIADTARRVNATLIAGCGALVIFLYVGQLSITQTLTAELSPSQQMLRKMR